MRKPVNLNNFLADETSVGDWGGKERVAADNLNKIYEAVYAAADNNINDDELTQILQRVFDDWGSDALLLTLTHRHIDKYVNEVLS